MTVHTGATFVSFQTHGCRSNRNEINSLEHVQVFLDLEHEKRGGLEIFLKSPSGKFVNIIFILVHASNFPKQEQYQCCYQGDRMTHRRTGSRSGTFRVFIFGGSIPEDDGMFSSEIGYAKLSS
jgi:subtilisin-like proprotein convertase family protein